MDQTLGLHLEANNRQPLYQQIADQIRGRIQSGALPSGTRLPPTRTLAQSLGTTRNTVVRAFEDLNAAGWLESIVGRGTFVRALRAPEPPVAPTPNPVPWALHFSKLSGAEPLHRARQLTAGLTERPCIDTRSMQPPSEMLPVAELRRCLDHVLRTRSRKALAYGPAEGVAPLRVQLCADLGRRGVPCRPEDIVVTSGSTQALDLLARTLVDPGDTVLVDPQTYAGALGIFTLAGAAVAAVPGDDEGPALDALERHRDATALYVMPDGQNPTGRCMTRTRRLALVQWSRRRGVPLIEDDYAADLDLDDAVVPPALRALDGEVLYVSTMSKKLVPALRIGLVVCPPPVRERLLAVKRTIDMCGSSLMQYALAEFLDRGHLRAHMARVVPEYRRRRDALVAALHAHLPAGCSVRTTRRGLSLWVELPTGVDPAQVFATAQREGVLVMPGTLNTPAGSVPSGIRMTFCTEPPARLAQAAERVASAITSVMRHPTTPLDPLEGP